jgi:hypothetical protein
LQGAIAVKQIKEKIDFQRVLILRLAPVFSSDCPFKGFISSLAAVEPMDILSLKSTESGVNMQAFSFFLTQKNF